MSRYKKLTILHSNDMHWDFFAQKENEKLIWWISCLSWYIQETRKNEKNCLYVISWDMFQWSVIDNEFKWVSTIDIMNILNPDVVTLWNHEVDYGLTHLLFLEKMAMFPIINANMYIKTSKTRLFKPYYIKEVDWMKILFIWIITENVLDWVKWDHLISTFVWVEEAAREVEKICNTYKKIDIDFTVLLTHIGYDEDINLAKLLKPELWIDLIIWWHSHTLLDKPTEVNWIKIVQVWNGTNQIWRFDIKIDTKNNCIEDYTWKVIPIYSETCPKDKKVDKILHWYKNQVDAKYNRVLSKMLRDLTHPSRFEETEVWNLFSDILKDSLWLDIMCLWSGSLRNTLLESIVTLWELQEMYPYVWKIYNLKLTWKELNNMIKFIFSNKFHWKWEEFYQRSSWFHIKYNLKKDEIKRIFFMWKKIDDEKIYNLWLQEFHLNNAKNFFSLNVEKLKSKTKPKLICTNDFDIFEEYFSTNRNIKSEIEWRIIID